MDRAEIRKLAEAALADDHSVHARAVAALNEHGEVTVAPWVIAAAHREPALARAVLELLDKLGAVEKEYLSFALQSIGRDTDDAAPTPEEKP